MSDPITKFVDSLEDLLKACDGHKKSIERNLNQLTNSTFFTGAFSRPIQSEEVGH